MTLKLILAGILSVASSWAAAKPAALNFETATFAKLKSSTVAEVFCAQPTTYQLRTTCAEIKKQKESLNIKISAIEFESQSSVVIRHDKVTIKVSRTDRPTVFDVNHKEIDLTDYANFAGLEDAVANSFPKFSQFSLWMNLAYAQTSSEFGQWGPTREMARTISLMMLATSDSDICKSAKAVALQCRSYPHEIAESTNLIGLINLSSPSHDSLVRQAQKKKIETALSTFNKDVDRLVSNLSHLKNKKIQVLEQCSSVQGGGKTAFDDLDACQTSLLNAQDRMKVISAATLAEFRGSVDDFGLLLKSELKLSNPKKSSTGGGKGLSN